MAGSEFKDALKNMADTVAGYVKDAATLTVITQTTEVGSAAPPVLAARTVISLDGDNTTVLPVQKTESGNIVVDSTLHDLHQQNVAAAIDYRARILDSMLGLLKSRL